LPYVEDFDGVVNKYMTAKKRNYQVPEYQEGQLVAVQTRFALLGMPQANQLRWFRGVVEEKVEYDKNPYANTEVKVQLLDFGPRVKVPLHQVASLPLKFIRDAPLVRLVPVESKLALPLPSLPFSWTCLYS